MKLLPASIASVTLLAFSAFGIDEHERPPNPQDQQQPIVIGSLPDLTDRGINLLPTPMDREDNSSTHQGGKFRIFGRNSSATIRKLTHIAGNTIAALEASMRPNQASTSGFLAPNDSLLDVLAKDNDYVLGKGLTHQAIARELRILVKLAQANYPRNRMTASFRFKGIPLQVSELCTKGFQNSPFKDGTRHGCDYNFKNLLNGESTTVAGLCFDLIDRYGFYEGNIPYRVNVEKIVEKILTYLNPRR